jgi:hypothetical protein
MVIRGYASHHSYLRYPEWGIFMGNQDILRHCKIRYFSNIEADVKEIGKTIDKYCNQKIFNVNRTTLFASRIDCICMMWLVFLLYTLLNNVNLKTYQYCNEQYHHSRRRRGCT